MVRESVDRSRCCCCWEFLISDMQGLISPRGEGRSREVAALRRHSLIASPQSIDTIVLSDALKGPLLTRVHFSLLLLLLLLFSAFSQFT